MDQDKKGAYNGVLMIVVLLTFVIIGHWLLKMELIELNMPVQNNMFLDFVDKNGYLLRGIFIIGVPSMVILIPSSKRKKNQKPEDKSFYLLLSFLFSAIVIFGYSTPYYFYNLLFPLMVIIYLVVTTTAYSYFKTKLVTKDVLGQTSNVTKGVDLSETFTFETNKGLLRIHNPFQGILVEGGAGAGKSASLIEPIIHQSVLNGWSAYIYDYKGNPPTLGLTAYNSIMEAKSLGKVTSEFSIINFSLLEYSARINPISQKYITDYLFCQEVIGVFMKALNKQWIEKSDFWSQSAMIYVQAIAWRLVKNPKLKSYCTLPHVISLTLSDYELVLEWLLADKDLEKIMQPFVVAHKKKADQQIAGQVSSAQVSMSSILEPNIYWVLSPNEDEMFDLDISNKANPKILSISNDPQKQEALSPTISLITAVVKQKINQQGKNKCNFIIDELPTLYIQKLDELPATARSNKVATTVGIQDRSQMIRDYDKKNSDTTLANLGTAFVGMTNNLETAKTLCAMIGKNEIEKVSYSTQSGSGSVSTSESLQMQDVLQPKDLMGQDIGHFTGKIAGGKPALFSAQFPYFDQKKVYKKKHKIDDLPKTGLNQLDLKISLENIYLGDDEFQKLLKDKPALMSKEDYKKDCLKIKELEMKKKILDQLVILNYNTINNDVEELLNNA